MSATIAFAATVKNACASARATAFNGLTGPLYLKLYDGTQPAAGGALSGNTLICSIRLADTPCSASGAVITFAWHDASSLILATGTPTWGRIVDNANAWVMDGNAGTSGAFFVLDSSPFPAGGAILMGTTTYTEQ